MSDLFDIFKCYQTILIVPILGGFENTMTFSGAELRQSEDELAPKHWRGAELPQIGTRVGAELQQIGDELRQIGTRIDAGFECNGKTRWQEKTSLR